MKRLLFLMVLLSAALRAQVSWNDQREWTATASVANTYTVGIPNFTYAIGREVKIRWATTNSGAITLAINGGAAKAVVANGASLSAGAIVVNLVSRLTYDGTQWSIVLGSGASGGGGGIATINTLSGADQIITTGSAGTDVGVSSSGVTHTLNIPTASATNRGVLSSSDWSNFNSAFEWGNHAGLYQPLNTKLTAIAGLANSVGWLYNNGSGTFSYATPTKADVGLGLVENIALSTWAGSSNLTTLGVLNQNLYLTGATRQFGLNTNHGLEIVTNGNTRLNIAANGGVTFTQDSRSSTHTFATFTQNNHTGGSPTGLLLTGGAHTTLAASTEASDLHLNLGRTIQFNAGAITNQRAARISAPTYGFVSASTIDRASTLAISGAPVAGTNATITNTNALDLESGDLRLGAAPLNDDALTRVLVHDPTSGKVKFREASSMIATSIGGITGSKTQFNTSLTDGDFQFVGDAPTAHTLDSHSNVAITSNTSGEILKWNGTAWINNTLAEAGIQAAGTYATGTGTANGSNTGDQSLNNTSDATSHTVTLTGGTSLQLIEGTNVTMTTGGTAGTATLTINASGGGGGGISNTAANNEVMKSDGTNAVPSGMWVSGGNLGVGVTNPSTKLEVAGDIISKGNIWTARAGASGGLSGLREVCYGNGLFVAVSNLGASRIQSSPDGIHWTARTAPNSGQWYSVTYGNGIFVAVSFAGTEKVATSTDGLNWVPRTQAGTVGWKSITFGNGLFVAVSPSLTSEVQTSPDGVNWTLRTGVLDDYNSIVFGNGLFVAVGINSIQTSPDGVNWTSRTPAEANSWESVTYGNGLFVAVASSGANRVQTSPDGITWTSRTAAEANSWESVTYGNGLFVAVASDGTNRVQTSPDGITWTARSASEANTWESVCYGNGMFVAVASDGTNQVMTSGKSELNLITELKPFVSSVISPAQITGDQDNYNPPGWDDATLVRLDGDVSIRAITSFAAPTGSTKPQTKRLINVGSNPIYLPGEHPDGTATNRLLVLQDFILFPKEAVEIEYNTTDNRWVVDGDMDKNWIGKGPAYSFSPGSITAADWGDLGLTVSGTSAANSSQAASTTLPGSFRQTTGTTATGIAAVSAAKTVNNFTAFGAAHIWAESTWSLGTLSDGTETFNSYPIMITNAPTSTTGEPNNSVFIRYSHGVNSGKFQLVSQDNAGAESTADTGITVAINTLYKIRVEVDKAKTEVRAYINDSFVARVTANLPNSVVCGARAAIQKSVGVTSRTQDVHTLSAGAIYN